MKKYGQKKIGTKVKGHQNCGTCHPAQKSRKARARRAALKEIEEQLTTPP